MEIHDTFLEIVIDELDRPLEDYSEDIQKSIKQWPDLIYDVIRLVQKKAPDSNYRFKLPCGSGALEVTRNQRTMKMTFSYVEVKYPSRQAKFHSLLNSVYRDIDEESRLKNKILSLMTMCFMSLDSLINRFI